MATATKAAIAKHRLELEEARRLAALQVDTLAHAVTSVDDQVGWTRLTELGTTSTVRAQEAGVTSTVDMLNRTLEAVDMVGDFAARLPGVEPGRLASGRPVVGMFAKTQNIVQARMAGGATFPEGLDASANVLTAIASSEPHRIARDGPFNVGLSDSRFNRYRRVAVGATCPFCRMLATRGAVYLTPESAGRGRQYHYKCDCYVELVADPAAIESSKGLQKDWWNAIRDGRQTNAGQLTEFANLSDAQVDQLARRAGADQSAELAAEVARRKTGPVAFTPATDISEVLVVTRPDAAQVKTLKVERQVTNARRKIYTDRIAEARTVQAARKAELKAAGIPAKQIRRDYTVRRQQKIINRGMKWERQLSREIGALDLKLAAQDFDLGSSPAATWRVGAPLSVEAAAKGANPQYAANSGAKVNCTRVVQAVELRRRGVDVVAKPMTTKRGTMIQIVEDAWIDGSGNPRRMRRNIAYKTVTDEIDGWPTGARGIMEGTWSRGGGSHVWNVEKLADGTVTFIEGQDASGALAPTTYVHRMKPGSLGLLRVDDLWPNQHMVDVVEGG